MVFAQLCLTQHEVVINFLTSVDVNGRNGLVIVLSAWLANHTDFQGLYNQKVSTVALSKIYMSGDARVANVQVNGDLIVPKSTRKFSTPCPCFHSCFAFTPGLAPFEYALMMERVRPHTVVN